MIATASQLSRSLEPEFCVHPWESFPRLSEVRATDIVVADLADFPSGADLDRLRGLLDCSDLWLVVDEGVAYAEFLQVLAGTTTHVFACTPHDRSDGFRSLARALGERLQGPPVHEIAELVLSKEPVLRSVEGLVRAICSRPHDIRRPRDLASAGSLRISDLKRRVATLGFTRIEHFIVTVRTVAYEQLVVQRKLPVQVARRLSGITDPSNHRREMGRALTNSPNATKRLASFAGAVLLGLLLSRATGCAKTVLAATSRNDSVHGFESLAPRDSLGRSLWRPRRLDELVRRLYNTHANPAWADHCRLDRCESRTDTLVRIT